MWEKDSGWLNDEGCWGGTVACRVLVAKVWLMERVEYAIADSSYLLRVPEGINAVEAAPILCAGTTVYQALKVTKIARRGWMAIVGAGGGLVHL